MGLSGLALRGQAIAHKGTRVRLPTAPRLSVNYEEEKQPKGARMSYRIDAFFTASEANCRYCDDALTNNNTKRGASRLINNSLWLLCDECESFSSLSIG